MPPVLIADIGGTNARFAMLENGQPRDTQILAVRDYANIDSAIESYFHQIGLTTRPSAAVCALACPILGDEVELTNHAWRFSISAVQAKLGMQRFVAINDFAAVAWAVPGLSSADWLPIGPDLPPLAGEPIAIIGPGSGLGVGSLVPVADNWRVLPGEGGHVTLPAITTREAAVITWAWNKFSHVSAERLVSGKGLVTLRDGLISLDHGHAVAMTEASQITAAALDKSCPFAIEAVDLFFAMLGTVTGNLALTLGARGGVYLAGGILPKLKDLFVQSAFRQRFEDKGRMTPYLRPIPTRLIIDKLPAFSGLATYVRYNF